MPRTETFEAPRYDPAAGLALSGSAALRGTCVVAQLLRPKSASLDVLRREQFLEHAR
jgi:hypothetical protein